eukprot:GABV01001429.1.p1 GENE.GABV01001429.1~~GABV01001429.1.p1  ORF type:complete len:196 (+),score=47.70 GABV01001429.1:154-741(+)
MTFVRLLKVLVILPTFILCKKTTNVLLLWILNPRKNKPVQSILTAEFRFEGKKCVSMSQDAIHLGFGSEICLQTPTKTNLPRFFPPRVTLFACRIRGTHGEYAFVRFATGPERERALREIGPSATLHGQRLNVKHVRGDQSTSELPGGRTLHVVGAPLDDDDPDQIRFQLEAILGSETAIEEIKFKKGRLVCPQR